MARWQRRDDVRDWRGHGHPGPQRRASQLLHARVPRDASPGRRFARRGIEAWRLRDGVRVLERAQLQASAVCLVESLHRRVLRSLRPPLFDGDLDRLQDPLMAETTSFTYDVLVIGAGGAGLRAAIEAANAGVSVGLICKSLLGKAHTVMAEGGMAAAMAHNDDRDSWKVHFADTMRGGQYVNNWRMAEIHAKEAPDRVRELEGWGAVFDRTADGRINQRNFGGQYVNNWRMAEIHAKEAPDRVRELE